MSTFSSTPWSWLLYCALLMIRVIVAPFLPGYIHPDEFFQSGQELWFGCDHPHNDVPWEFQPQHALRSVLPPLTMTWMPLQVYSWILNKPMEHLSGQEVLVVPRVACALASILLVDGTVWRLSQSKDDNNSRKGGVPTSVLLLASAWPAMVMLSRPFSNTMETDCLAALFRIVLPRILSSDNNVFSVSFVIQVGVVCAVGLFTRFTFAFFAAPILLFLLYQMLQQRGSTIWRILNSLGWMVVSFVVTSLAIVGMDTRYYQGIAQAQQEPSDLASFQLPFTSLQVILTPLNALLYNSQVSNLKDHGLHPQWTHSLVNMFILYGPLTLVAYLSFLRLPYATTYDRTDNSRNTLMDVSQATVLFGLAFLSAAPHQEPRFLLPLLVPLILVGGPFVRESRIRPYFALLWIVFNAALITLFGLLHQAGVIHSLLGIGLSLVDRTPSVWIYWRTYMPPTFLTRKSNGQSACVEGNRVVDLKGSSVESLWETLESALKCDPTEKAADSILHLVVPYLKQEDRAGELVFAGDWQCHLPSNLYNCKYIADFGPHLTTEDFPIVDKTSSSPDLYSYFVLGVYEITCNP